VRCSGGSCSSPPETIQVTDFETSDGSPDIACDNRPLYHFAPANNPDPATHYVFDTFFRGQIAETAPSEGIFGMVWDTLDGNGSPSSPVNAQILQAVKDWKANARGVILDHRAGNGGTLDAATNVTGLVRPPSVVAVTRMPIEQAGYDGPATTAAGLAVFTLAEGVSPYKVGDPAWDQTLPVALITHRDGSASDYLPYGMKGAPNVQIFGPHQTSGAFSTFIEFSSWGNLYFQFASGDTIAADGSALIGHGVPPDVVLLPTQSDLVAGRDTLFEAALAWVRKEQSP
jgi:C-terminal processing protease CtpA/Prc